MYYSLGIFVLLTGLDSFQFYFVCTAIHFNMIMYEYSSSLPKETAFFFLSKLELIGNLKHTGFVIGPPAAFLLHYFTCKLLYIYYHFVLYDGC